MYEIKIAGLTQQLKEEHCQLVDAEEQLDLARKVPNDQQSAVQVNVHVEL